MRWLITRTAKVDSTENYRRWVTAAGIEPVITGDDGSLPEQLAGLDALLLSGGVDVNPALYGQTPHAMTREVEKARDELERRLVRRFLDAGRPVFGVCRGIQMLAVALGGALIQHVPDVIDAQGQSEEHRAPAGSRAEARHGLVFVGKSGLRNELKGVTEVNSAHHQAVDPSRPGKGLRIIAVSPAGIVEAAEGEGLSSPVLAVQWHPERLKPQDAASRRLLELMISLCV